MPGCATAIYSSKSSPTAMMAAANQRTSRIELGTVVTPLGWKTTVDLLAGDESIRVS
jgi:alkanesulfonate monooxygenase SsuD/methylene tetrahydromethanopterin reductase-like flavin-dependent oxidoreductase (luciferase family)